jgi:hypothetical protein
LLYPAIPERFSGEKPAMPHIRDQGLKWASFPSQQPETSSGLQKML